MGSAVIVAIVPALDEAERISVVCSTMPARIGRIVVVDDGSTDQTGAIAGGADPRVEVVRHASPRGVGAAIATGMLAARDADAAVVLAGDGQMDPRDLDALLDPVVEDRADLVKGNRLAWPNGALTFPLPRLLGVIAFTAATRAVTGLAIDDAQCGYVAVGSSAIAAVPWRALWPSFGYPNDLLAHAARLGLRIEEVPVRPIYAGERSHLRARHLPGFGYVLLRALLSRARG
jgi:glycosyltransferase involved in cell wall biosynthesis